MLVTFSNLVLCSASCSHIVCVCLKWRQGHFPLCAKEHVDIINEMKEVEGQFAVAFCPVCYTYVGYARARSVLQQQGDSVPYKLRSQERRKL